MNLINPKRIMVYIFLGLSLIIGAGSFFIYLKYGYNPNIALCCLPTLISIMLVLWLLCSLLWSGAKKDDIRDLDIERRKRKLNI